MLNPDVARRLLKVLALARHGADGEKQAAEQHLTAMLKKFKVSECELNDISAPTEKFCFKYKDEIELHLLRQIVARTCETNNVRCYSVVGKRKAIAFYLTPSQNSEITIAYTIYRKKMAEEMELCFRAFVQANDIYAPSELCAEIELSAEQVEAAKKIMARAKLIGGTVIHKALQLT